jgi:hypothetical protein
MAYAPPRLKMRCEICMADLSDHAKKTWVDDGCSCHQAECSLVMTARRSTRIRFAPSRSVKPRRGVCLRGGAREGEHSRAKEEEQIRRGRPHVEAACWLGRKGSAATNMPSLVALLERAARGLGATTEVEATQRLKQDARTCSRSSSARSRQFPEELAESDWCAASIDESTDVSDSQTAGICVFFVKNGEASCAHCICHRLALAANEFAALTSHASVVEKTLRAIRRIFAFSSKREDAKIQEVNDESGTIKKRHTVRWLSRKGALASVVGSFRSVLDFVVGLAAMTPNVRAEALGQWFNCGDCGANRFVSGGID